MPPFPSLERFLRGHALPGLLALAGLLFATSCGDRAAEEQEEAPSTASPPPASFQSGTVVMPPSGQITTSAGTPSSPTKRVLSPEEQARALNLMLNRLAERQEQGLGDGGVTVNAAWEYDGYSYLAPNPDSPIPARMVAVDLTVEGHQKEFDPDDIEIVDGVTRISYGSDPHLTLIKAPGEIISDPADFPEAPRPTRMLLLYAFPKDSHTFTLYYWGQNLLDKPLEFEKSGWGLPFPE